MWLIVVPVVAGLAAVAAGALAYGSGRWRSATGQMQARLEAGRLPPGAGRYDRSELTGLPAPVRRCFQAALTEGQPMVSAVCLEHCGAFNIGETGDRWRPFVSRQRVITRRPGFHWGARVALMPGLSVRVHDTYIAGEGLLHASLFGLVSLVNLRGTSEVARGEPMRFSAKAAWYPTALLPSQGVRWEAVDNASARATLTDGEITLELLFRFNDDGLIESVRAEARGRTVAGSVVPTPWEGRWSSYEFAEQPDPGRGAAGRRLTRIICMAVGGLEERHWSAVKSTRARSMRAEELDRRFDMGEDVWECLDVSRARKPARGRRMVVTISRSTLRIAERLGKDSSYSARTGPKA